MCPEQREGAERERVRSVEGQRRLAHPLQEKSSFPVSLLAVVWNHVEERTLRVFPSSEA